MNIEECYSFMGEDFEAVKMRLMKVDRIEKYFRRIFEEGYYDKLVAAFKSGVVEDIFVASHDMKGVCLNLGLNKLAAVSSDLCEAVRGGIVKGDIDTLMAEVDKSYLTVLDAFQKLEKM